MNREDIVRLPVLFYLSRIIERQLRGQPALIILDEAWLMLGNPVFRSTIRTVRHDHWFGRSLQAISWERKFRRLVE